MFRRNFFIDRFLESVVGTEPFRAYCGARGIPFTPPRTSGNGRELAARWQLALATLVELTRADVELELAQVNDLAERDSIYHLIDVCARRGLPSDLVPGEEAQALWFLVHRPAVFQEVFFHEEVLEAESWQNAQTRPGIDLANHAGRRPAFEQALAQFYGIQEGAGRFCASQSYRFADPNCVVFVGFVSDRLRFLEAFTEEGQHRRQKVRTAAQVLFAYYPADGAVLLKSRHWAESKVRTLLGSLCRDVLGTEMDERSLGCRFDLDKLLTRFDPPLPEGIAQVRVKALELAYPATQGRRRLRLETNAGDGPFAIQDLLKAHIDREPMRSRLRVIEAELQVKLTLRGRKRSHFIRLWPNRCSLNQTPTAEVLRRCLASWGLSHAPQP